VLISPGQDPGRQTWAVQIIDRQVATLGQLLDDLLEASRITRGTMALRKEDIVMRGVVDAAVELTHPALDRQGHDFSISGDALDQALHADPLRLTQVLGILLDNAAQYTPPGGRIELSVNRRGNQLELRVQDNGIGLAPGDLERVFDIFTQIRAVAAPAPGTDLRQSERGLGIGLALVKGFVELHGGSVSVSSPGLGQGCVFLMLLPLNEDAPQPAQVVPQPGRVAAAAGRLQVLVVDDNHDGADTLAVLLRHAGHHVDVAYDGQEALRLAQNHHPDVALIDLGMPQLDGCEVARRLRCEPWGDAVYLIAATGWGQTEDRRRTQASGFDRHLVKPIDPLHIVQMLADRGLRGRTPPPGARC
jgi:CheY-like chemotaxis protein